MPDRHAADSGWPVTSTFAIKMKPLCVIIVFLSISACIAGIVSEPPSESIVASECKAPADAVSRTVKLPGEDPKLKERMMWLATYTFSKPVDFGITLVCVPHGRFKQQSFDAISTRPELEYKKIDLSDGSVIHHSLVDRGDQGTSYGTTLVTKDGPYDYILGISRPPNVSEKDVPIDIKTVGIELVQKLTNQK